MNHAPTAAADDAGRRARWEWPALLALALFAAAAAWFGTPWGLGLSPDSVAYLSGARDLAQHGDLAKLPAHWPPGYPLLLAAAAKVCADITLGARLLHAVLFALNALLLAALARHATRHAALACVLTFLLLLQPPLLQPHLVLWSEPAFLALVFADLLLLLHWAHQPPTAARVAALGAVAGLALLQRYAGAYLIALNVLAWLLSYAPGEWWRRLRAAAACALVAGLPLLAWLGWRSTHAGAAEVRTLAWHPAGLSALRAMGTTLAGWFGLPATAAWPALAALLGLCAYAWWRRPPLATRHRLARLLSLGAVCYLGILWLSASLFDANIPFDSRVLLPLLPTAALLMVGAARPVIERPASLLPAVGVVAALALAAGDGVRLWLTSRHDGLGLASRPLQQMPVLRVLAGFPRTWHVASNGPELFVVHLDRRAQMLPYGLDLKTQRHNPDFGRQMDAMAASADAIVLFRVMDFRHYLPPPEMVDRLPGFRRSYDAADATIWLRQPPGGEAQ